jgi:hypothetical protein
LRSAAPGLLCDCRDIEAIAGRRADCAVGEGELLTAASLAAAAIWGRELAVGRRETPPGFCASTGASCDC